MALFVSYYIIIRLKKLNTKFFYEFIVSAKRTLYKELKNKLTNYIWWAMLIDAHVLR